MDPSAYPPSHADVRLWYEEDEDGVYLVWLDKSHEAQEGPKTQRSEEPVSGRTGTDCGGVPSVM